MSKSPSRGAPEQIMLIPKSILFLTGGITIALEIVASRVMTPYFGSSLYVWTAILSITLLSLALGYAGGGRITRNGSERVRLAFVTSPILAGLGLVFGVLCFPILPALAGIDIVVGAFIAATLLLAPCLILLSALNPLLVALLDRSAVGDAGSGSVFALSTVGSVLGGLAASFALVPNFATDHILLGLAALLGLSAMAAAAMLLSGRRRVLAVLLALVPMSGAPLVSLIMPQPQAIALGPGVTARLVDTFHSAYGSVHVIELTHDAYPERRLIGYVQNGGLQGMIHGDGRSATRYASVLVEAVRTYKPEARRILMAGLATGIVARSLDELGVSVEVIDINPDSPDIARRYFGFDPSRIAVHIEDARLFFSRCAGSGYDAVILDAFSGLEIPEHLITVEAISAAASCLAEDGILLANVILPSASTPVTEAVLATVQAALPGPLHLFPLTDDNLGTPMRNQILVAGRRLPPTALPLALDEYPVGFFDLENRTFRGQVFGPDDLAYAVVLSDRKNPFSVLAAGSQARRGVWPFPPGW